jgi:shikimate kinase
MTPGADAPAGAPIVFVGPPGSGKTTIGRLLAAELGAEFLDVDELISQRTGKTITEIFSEDGEAHFRQLERATTIETIEAAQQQPQMVIALGGGAPMAEPVRAALAGSRVVWLRVGIAAGAKRVGLNTARPLLLGNVRGQMIKLMREREPYYASVAQIRIDTDDRSPQELTASITELL